MPQLDMGNSAVTQARVKELFVYAPDTGVITRRVSVGRHGRHKKGSVVGTNQNHGYLVIGVDGRVYMAHRIAWLYTYGRWPAGDLDHINQDKKDNRIANLREVTRSQNMRNVSHHKHNSSGHVGVSWHKPRLKWRAYIFDKYKQKHLGLFDTFDAAVAARTRAADDLAPS
jgi:hypothetical protein